MITLFIFYLHLIAGVAIFTKRWQEEGLKEGFLGVGFLALIFSVGWSITTFVMQLLIDQRGFGPLLDRDTLALLLLVVVESVFFSYQLRKKRRKIQAA